jgi:hypothetical protein
MVKTLAMNSEQIGKVVSLFWQYNALVPLFQLLSFDYH